MIPALPEHDWIAALDALAGPGWVMLPAAIPSPLLDALRDELLTQDAAGVFHMAGIGRGAAHHVAQTIRGDRIAWLQEDWPAAAAYLSFMDDLRQALNRALFLGLAEYEAHYACYEAGAGYRRHVDRHASGQGGARVVSTVCYLNAPGWPETGGGELVLYPAGNEPVLIRPEGGSLVLFRSDDLPHEVRPATRQRLSVAGWMRTRA